ncbi:VOC family protein [Allonocardiopsis opalescens]|uniref:Glyoxalase-like protein n=1 Tax=Allonocardiopsis opalescens TaxID=1144618 RepID=A0A2T0PXS0_9ACTN|nr:VOC family protein [Allonocardiopsis opalescens]PRX96196.1 glyoxalase-like protein [Allonocardiopsis opalescens]
MNPAAPGGIGRLHHVGLVVRDMAEAIARYRRLGFHVPPAAFPALPPREGAPPEPVGAGNTRIRFAHAFVELAAVLPPGENGAPDPAAAGPGAAVVPLQAPPEALPRLAASMKETSARLAAALERFEGLHIAVFRTADADAAAARLTAAGVPHSGVHRLRRPAADGGTVPVGYLEIDGAGGRTPEGRLAIAEDPGGPAAESAAAHPNGAVDLVEAVLCVPAAELAEAERRYAGYLGRPARPARPAGPARVFALGRSRLVVVGDTGLPEVLPGERPAALPAFVSCAVAVRDIAAARAHLAAAGVPFTETGAGELTVPSAEAMGAALVFRERADT